MTISFEYDMTPDDLALIARMENVSPEQVTEEVIQSYARGALIFRMNDDDLGRG